jgi:hypothetical protein
MTGSLVVFAQARYINLVHLCKTFSEKVCKSKQPYPIKVDINKDIHNSYVREDAESSARNFDWFRPFIAAEIDLVTRYSFNPRPRVGGDRERR